jgi:hypothetical protein
MKIGRTMIRTETDHKEWEVLLAIMVAVIVALYGPRKP